MSINDWTQDQKNRFYHLQPTENEPLVCKKCIIDNYIISNLRDKYVLGECLFCKIETDVVEMEYFFDQIIDAIKSDGWVFAIDEGSYNSAEGGWQHSTSECNDVNLALT